MKINVASGLPRALKAHPDFIGGSPFEVAPPQRFTVEGQIENCREDGSVLKLKTSAKRRDVANKALPNQRTTAVDHKRRRRNTSANYSSSVHHMIKVRTNS